MPKAAVLGLQMPTPVWSCLTHIPLNEAILVFCLLGWYSIFPQHQGHLFVVICWQTNVLLTYVLIQEQVYFSSRSVTMLWLLRARFFHSVAVALQPSQGLPGSSLEWEPERFKKEGPAVLITMESLFKCLLPWHPSLEAHLSHTKWSSLSGHIEAYGQSPPSTWHRWWSETCWSFSLFFFFLFKKEHKVKSMQNRDYANFDFPGK